MKVAFLAALPFHEWCLEDLRTACDEAGHTTEMFVHRPAHGHDWLSTDGGRYLRDDGRIYAPAAMGTNASRIYTASGVEVGTFASGA